jgi:hypothetical protein
MGRTIENYLLEMELGAAQGFKNMAVFPLTMPSNGGPEYITLKEALERSVLSVTETSQGGSVPELRVENKGDVAVLLLDGEEVAGAKQNRVLNTTILVAGKSRLVVPVSCTEHGRWSYVSYEFVESGHMMARSIRGINMAAVHVNLEERRGFHGDQAKVWDEVNKLASDAHVQSATGAMKDVFDARRADLEDYLKEFRAVDGQKGLLVFIDGRAVGFDFVSRPAAFGLLFPKLLKSYAMEAMIASGRRKQRGGKTGEGTEESKRPAVKVPVAEQARAFLSAAAACEEKKQESVGMGWHFRYSGNKMVGSALAVEEKVVHMAFFRIDEAEKAGSMAGLRSRRGFRIV